MEENWFGLNRGQMTSVGTKVNSTSQKLLACKISGIFVHWGPFYGTFWWSSLTLLPPFVESLLKEITKGDCKQLRFLLADLQLVETAVSNQSVNFLNSFIAFLLETAK